MKFLTLILSLGLFVGCSSSDVNQVLKTDTIYKRDMIITVNGFTKEGMLTMPLLAKNTIHIVTAGDLDLFVLDNCSGEWTSPQAWNVTSQVKGGLFNWFTETVSQKRERVFEYVPPAKAEACPLTMAAFSVDGQDSWGYVGWQTSEFKLGGTIICNSESRAFEGYEACQTRMGKRTEIHFTSEVNISPDKGCEIGSTSGKDFVFPTPRGFCTYRIKDRKSKSVGRLDLLGYDGILVRAAATEQSDKLRRLKRRTVK